MSTLFDAPSPKGTNFARLFLNKRGHLIDGRTGAYWGRSRMMAMDAALPEASSGPKKPVNHHASAARLELNSALQKLCSALGLEHEEISGQIGDILDEAERVQVQEYAASLGGGKGAGKGAIDKTKGAAARDREDEDDASVEQRVRKFLAGKGLDDEAIEEALKRVRADREAARDARPKNAIHGGMGGHLSGATKDDIESEYGGSHLLDLPDYTPDPDRGLPGYDPNVYRASERAVAKVAGGGVGRRLQTPPGAGDEDIAFDEENFMTDIEREILAEYGGGHIKVGVWGR
jgi:hypothetical protein